MNKNLHSFIPPYMQNDQSKQDEQSSKPRSIEKPSYSIVQDSSKPLFLDNTNLGLFIYFSNSKFISICYFSNYFISSKKFVLCSFDFDKSETFI
jgi:hypothetical protein